MYANANALALHIERILIPGMVHVDVLLAGLIGSVALALEYEAKHH